MATLGANYVWVRETASRDVRVTLFPAESLSVVITTVNNFSWSSYMEYKYALRYIHLAKAVTNPSTNGSRHKNWDLRYKQRNISSTLSANSSEYSPAASLHMRSVTMV
ncbi:hypothetical protein BELL_0355g00110 [Botrytis elliptica]|uniref:Uncharacterized protein n=1 Tax=Botrytis elliptica TaxID=278938 RepID=A0A4Z1JJL6_9HELO|nr:hypothetical protein EAE99_011623 [Botrytis elliptica]TGO73514.1 hypothetical protein BELL_0355g00110 [Botrytis elliptica]